MPLEDEIDGPSESKTKPGARRSIIKARHVLYLHYVAAILSVLIGLCELRGYGAVLETGIVGLIFGLIVLVLLISTVFLPVSFFVLWMRETPRERLFWIMGPLSALLSFVQFLALFKVGVRN